MRKAERAIPERDSISLSIRFSCPTTLWSSAEKQYGFHCGFSNLISLKIVGGGCTNCIKLFVSYFIKSKIDLKCLAKQK